MNVESNAPAPEIGKRLVLPFIALVIVVMIGAVGYFYLGDGRWTFSECAYMVVITLTTVGYGEVLPGFAEVEHVRSFTILLLVFGMGTFLYFASSVTAVLIEGDLRRAVARQRMHKRIRRMKNHYIVCGVGSTGKRIIEELILADKTIIAIDRDVEVLGELDAHYKGKSKFNFVAGDATEDDVLAAANVETARGVIAALADDKDNLYLTVSVRAANPSARIVARGSDLGVLDKLKKAGAHACVSPNHVGGMRMVSELLRPHVVRFLDEMLRDEKNIRLEEIELQEGSPLVGKALGELRLRTDLEVGVVAVLSDRQYSYNPHADLRLEAGMVLVLLGPVARINKLRERAGGLT